MIVVLTRAVTAEMMSMRCFDPQSVLKIGLILFPDRLDVGNELRMTPVCLAWETEQRVLTSTEMRKTLGDTSLGGKCGLGHVNCEMFIRYLSEDVSTTLNACYSLYLSSTSHNLTLLCREQGRKGKMKTLPLLANIVRPTIRKRIFILVTPSWNMRPLDSILLSVVMSRLANTLNE